MAGGQKGSSRPKKISGTVDILHDVVDGKNLFAVPRIASAAVAGPCDGKADGTPCGDGCICRGGQPWYSFRGITKLGVRPQVKRN